MGTISLEDRLLDRFHRVEKRTWVAVAAALLVGLLTHIAAMTGILINSDNGYPVLGYQWLVGSGRWMQGVLGELRGHVGMGTVTAPLAILFIALSAGGVVSILDIRSGVLSGLAGGLLATFPAIVCTASYAIHVDMYFFALLLAVAGVYCVKRWRYGWIPGTVLMAMSMGTYQAYISMAAGLLVLLCLRDTLRGTASPKKILLKGLGFIGVLALSVALYYGMVRISVAATGTALSDYQGINNMAVLDPAAILHAVTGSYWKLGKFFLLDRYGVTNGTFACWLYRLTLALSGLGYVLLAARTGLFKKPGLLATSLLCLVLLPLGVSFVAVLWQNPEIGWLQSYAYLLIFLLPILFTDMLCHPKETNVDVLADRKRLWPKTVMSLGTVAIALLLTFNWYATSTQCYSKMRLGYEAATAECLMIATELTALPGFTEETPIALLGSAALRDYDSQFAYLENFDGVAGKSMIGDSNMLKRLLTNYYQVYFTYADGDMLAKAAGNPLCETMPCWPDNGSIQMVDGVAVVKLS